MLEELLLKAPCSIAICEFMQKLPYLTVILGSAIGGLIGFGWFFKGRSKPIAVE